MNPFDSFNLPRFKFASVMAVLAASLPAGLAPELAKATAQQPPSPPPNPPPSQTRPGGGLNPDSSAICAPQNDSLQALVPVETPVLTASAHPIFFFYVPFSNEVVERAEFSMLLWPGELERHYKADILLPDSPGIVGVTLPDGPDYALDAGQNYRWYLNIYCQDGGGQQPDLTVNGVVQRVTLTAAGDRQGQGAAPEIWHDALASAVEQLERSPEDPNAVQQLLVLLQQIDAGDISEVSLAGRATPLSE
ncbi:MAG: DUF928 domain-containing protein [Cyanobacteria bacterium P01_A01_bin.135]